WVEAPISLGQVVMGRPLQRELRSGAYVGPGAGPSCPAPGDTRVGRGAGLPHLPAGLRETAVRERGDSRGGTCCGADQPWPARARRSASRAVAPRLLFGPHPRPARIGHKKHKKTRKEKEAGEPLPAPHGPLLFYVFLCFLWLPSAGCPSAS